ncbi:nucleotidyltransferase [Caballeronia sp. LjRoot29]|uniref:SMODS domain-containing nucleotidyltransferase n=1 Tax=Caballeronia sp. LjRoot29 TaxID=3342315 RepID=UPI003ED11F96
MSVISYLEARASAAVLSTTEESSINTSISTIKSRLASYFGTGLSEQFRFGSSTRGTTLPRSMDEHSDIDYMVVFSEGGYTPQTYLDRLKRFAEAYYASSDIKQSSPSVVLQLNHIKFDLVPALKQQWSGYRIPNGPNAWQDTNPNDFNATLTAKNMAELYKIKPTIRLVKYWNTYNGYIYDSYLLEKYIVGLSFYSAINLRDYVFTVFDGLSLSYDQPQWRKDQIDRAKDIVAKVRQYERDEMPASAEMEVKKLIPG